MLHKFTILFTVFVLASLVMGPIGIVRAQTPQASGCPPYRPQLLSNPSYLRSLPPGCMELYKQYYQQENGIQTKVSQITPKLVGGPDTFGYTYNDTVTYNWSDASTNSNVIGDDVASGPINIGFSFPFYGLSYSQLYFSTNGLVTFGSADSNPGLGNAIPMSNPTNFIAPFWEDLVVGGPSSAIYYAQGSEPSTPFILAWKNVITYSNSTPFSFEVKLYPNGDIVIQYESLPGTYDSTVGIENSVGDDGLGYQSGSSGLTAGTAVRFYYPTATTARVLASPLVKGNLVPQSGTSDYSFNISNIGSAGSDTYELTSTSIWPLTFYASDGVTPLTDTDGDSIIDTSSLAQAATETIIARFSPPGGTTVGNQNTATITATSHLDNTKTKTVTAVQAVSPGFANIFKDGADGAMSFMFASPNGPSVQKATTDNYYGYDETVAETSNGNYIYAWDHMTTTCSPTLCGDDIEYALLGHNGSLLRTVTKLTDNSKAQSSTYDFLPSVAVASNGATGVVFLHEVNDSGAYNDNIYFAILDGSGNLIYGPINLTNNTQSGTAGAQGVPFYNSPTIAATDDNRFIISWENDQFNGSNWKYNLWYAVRDTSGISIATPTALTGNDVNYGSVLNSLTGGKAILTWLTTTGGPYYAVLNSSGGISKAATSLNGSTMSRTPDAVALTDGNVAVGWATSSGIQLEMLDSGYNTLSGPTFESNPYTSSGNTSLSLTTDVLSHVIVTWEEGYPDYGQLFYALADSTGAFITSPIPYRQSSSLDTSSNGQGNAPFRHFLDVPVTYWAADWIERLANAGITAGCGNGNYCPDSSVTRAQMAIFLERGLRGASYSPPAATGTVFTDVPASYWAAAWIEQLAADQITGGCEIGLYCPDNDVTRAQMAVFLLKAEHGYTYLPPPATGTKFTDVSASYWAASWIEQLANEGITGGCGTNTYCPDSPVTRAQMAVFLVRTFGLP